jgi:nucleoside-diphosphate-sugar epimerase
MAEELHSVLVTGGVGFIGRNLLTALTGLGWKPVCLDSDPGEVAGCEKCDISEAARLEAIFQEHQFEAIIHLASVLATVSRGDPHRSTNVNIGGSLNILEAAKRFRVAKLIYASSLAVYGTRPASLFVSEDEAVTPEDLYGASKRYVELLGQAYQQNFGIRFVALRIAIVVGAGAKSVTSAWRGQIFESLEAGQSMEFAIPYPAEEVLPLVHVEDVVAMLVALVSARKPTASVYNSFAESVTASELKHNIELLNPKVRVKLGGRVVRGHPRAVDSTRFGKDFGLAPMPLRERLRIAVETVHKA